MAKEWLATAEQLIHDDTSGMVAGLRFRGAAFALRAALEASVAATLAAASVEVTAGGSRARFLCLRVCVDASTARRAKAVWGALCLACHYHHYELGPSRDQVQAWHADVVAVLGHLRA
jgi:cytochrome c5